MCCFKSWQNDIGKISGPAERFIWKDFIIGPAQDLFKNEWERLEQINISGRMQIKQEPPAQQQQPAAAAAAEEQLEQEGVEGGVDAIMRSAADAVPTPRLSAPFISIRSTFMNWKPEDRIRWR